MESFSIHNVREIGNGAEVNSIFTQEGVIFLTNIMLLKEKKNAKIIPNLLLILLFDYNCLYKVKV